MGKGGRTALQNDSILVIAKYERTKTNYKILALVVGIKRPPLASRDKS
jgi:hypothetical protein